MQKMDFFSLLSRIARLFLLRGSLEMALGWKNLWSSSWGEQDGPCFGASKALARLYNLHAQRAGKGEQGEDSGAAEIAPADG